MKHLRVLPALLLLFLLFFSGPVGMESLAQLSGGLKISAKLTQTGSETDGNSGTIEDWIYELEVENTGRTDLHNLKVQYRIYLYPEFGVDGTPESELEFNEYTMVIPDLKRYGKTGIKSDEMTLALAGARVKAKDVFQGLWVRIFDSAGKEVGTLLSPSNLDKKVEWEPTDQ